MAQPAVTDTTFAYELWLTPEQPLASISHPVLRRLKKMMFFSDLRLIRDGLDHPAILVGPEYNRRRID
jgi:hypothetical protein